MKKGIYIVSLLLLSLPLLAQESDKVKGAHPYKVAENEKVAEEYAHWSLIPHVGFNAFDGDFNAEMKHAVSIPSAGFAIEYNFTPVWNLGLEYRFSMYKVTGDTSSPENAEALLKGMMHKADAYISFDLMNLFFPKAQRKILGIQPLIGGGYAWYKNSAMYSDDMRYHTGSSEPLTMDKYKAVPFVMAGLNVEFNLNRTLALGVRATYDYFINDYPDGRGFSGMQALASKNNDGIVDVTLNMRFKLEAVSKTHVRNINSFDTWAEKKHEETKPVHDTVILRHDSIIIRETLRQFEKEREQEKYYYVYFANGKSDIDNEGLITIQQVAERLQEDTSLYAIVTGYCDNTGSNSLNYALGDRRADNVVDELVQEHGINPEHMHAGGMGKVIGRRSTASYGPNRRAAIRLVDKATFDRMKANLDDQKASRPAVEETVPLEKSSRPEKVNTYKQRGGDEVTVTKSMTLAKLAREYYNNTYCWVYIYIANKDKLTSPNVMPAGISLTIPELTQKEMQITKDESLVLYSNTRQGK
jgi:outer membrane protein OmpA-like peptidoglycan-associated protein